MRREPKPPGIGKKKGGRLTGNLSPTHPRRLEALQRDQQVLQLRLAGLTYNEIARQLNYGSPMGPQIALKRAMNRALGDQKHLAEEYRSVLLLRLERLHRAYWVAAVGAPEVGRPGDANYRPAQAADAKAADRILKIIASTMSLLGLEPPKGQTPIVDPQEVARDIQSALDEIQRSVSGLPVSSETPDEAIAGSEEEE